LTTHGATLPQSRPRLDYLDSLRALAVLTVFVTHVTEVFIRVTPKHQFLYQIFYQLNLGRVGVVTFFAISGFLIPTSLHGPVSPGLQRLAITRIFRLFPAYLVSLGPSFATYHIMTQGKYLTFHQALMNLTMVPRLFDAPMANGAYWTLEVEWVFYLLCALLFYGGILRNTFVLACLMFGLFVIFYSSQAPIWGGLLNPNLAADSFFFCVNLSCMFWGALVRRVWDKDQFQLLTIIMLAAVTFYWLAWMPGVFLLDHFGFIPKRALDSRLIAGYSIGLWLFVIGLFVVRIRNRLVSWFGRISYSFYLTHQAGLYLPFWLTLRFAVLQNRSMAWYLIVAAISSTIMASVSYYLVERRFIRLGRWLTRDLVG